MIVQEIGNLFFFLQNLEAKDNDDGRAYLHQQLPVEITLGLLNLMK